MTDYLVLAQRFEILCLTTFIFHTSLMSTTKRTQCVQGKLQLATLGVSCSQRPDWATIHFLTNSSVVLACDRTSTLLVSVLHVPV